MPPSKKWDASAERDLCIAMIMSSQDMDRAKHNWPAIHAFMDAIGYKFTKDALSFVSPFPFLLFFIIAFSSFVAEH